MRRIMAFVIPDHALRWQMGICEYIAEDLRRAYEVEMKRVIRRLVLGES